MRDGRVIFDVAVPKNQQSMMDDTPTHYRVIIPDQGACCCMIYGMYKGSWVANASARWLVRHLIEELHAAQGLIDELGHAIPDINA